MKEIIINDFDLKDEELTNIVTKSRGILLDGNKILVAHYNDVYLLPGGKSDKGEDEDQTFIREVEEETGIKYDLKDFNKLLRLVHYQKSYVNREDKLVNRKVTTYYYIGKYQGINKDNIKMSKSEINAHFYTELMDIDELKSNLSREIEMTKKSYYDRELLTVLEEIK